MKVIFLDIDGVMNRKELLKQSFDSIGEDHLNLLKFVVKTTDAQIVLSSTWRLIKKSKTKVESELNRFGLSLFDSTPNLDSDLRWKEIKSWLDQHPEVDDFVIIDDDPNAGSEWPYNFCLTNIKRGFDVYCAQKVIGILGPKNVDS